MALTLIRLASSLQGRPKFYILSIYLGGHTLLYDDPSRKVVQFDELFPNHQLPVKSSKPLESCKPDGHYSSFLYAQQLKNYAS